MAKELGMSPRSLIKNVPNKTQQWKAPVKEWIRDLHEKRFAGRPHTAPPAHPPIAGARAGAPLSPEIRDWDRLLSRIPLGQDWVQFQDLLLEDLTGPVTAGEIEEHNFMMLWRQKICRLTAEFVAAEAAKIPWVSKIVLMGSAAVPLKKEVPAFGRFHQSNIAVWRKCRDVDIALWVTECADVNPLRKARNRAITTAQQETDGGTNVPDHQIDMHLLEAGTDRFLGVLCAYAECPKGKPECLVPGCGAVAFLQQYADFAFDLAVIRPDRSRILFERKTLPAENPYNADDDVPF